MSAGEAEIVCAYVQFLMRMGVRQCDVGVISPYFAQVCFISSLFYNSFAVNFTLLG